MRCTPSTWGVQSNEAPVARTVPAESVQVTLDERSVPSEPVAVASRFTGLPSVIVPSGTAIETAGAAGTEAPTAAAASTRPPEPETVDRASTHVDESIRRSLTWSAVSPGATERTRAATPTTWGVAMDVPLYVAYPPPKTVERMAEPGAATSTPNSP